VNEATKQLVESWQTNNRINLFLVDNISPEGMKSTLSKRGGRSVARQMAHLHNNRIYHLEKRAAALAKGLTKFESKHEPTKSELKSHLKASAARVQSYIESVGAGESKYKCFKKGLAVYVSYFICHESHHRGNMLLTLKECGHNLDQKTRYAIWDWDRI